MYFWLVGKDSQPDTNIQQTQVFRLKQFEELKSLKFLEKWKGKMEQPSGKLTSGCLLFHYL